jgi:predicted NACHT family NTPase
MAERSLRATPEGIKKAKKACKDQGWTQTQIGEEIGTTRQPVGKFFAGKPIERPNFIDICRLLDLSWEDIAEPEPVEQNQKNHLDIDALVQEVRENIKPDIQERCGTMRVLDMSQPIGLNDIYTNVNILETITGRRRKDIAELLQECNSEDFERLGLSGITEERVPGLVAIEKYTKLIILGKPGAGKTTFLKYVAIQCNQGEFQANRVPIFVTLKDFAEAPNKPSLLEYIAQLVEQASRLPLEDSKQDAHRRQDARATDIKRLFNQGRMLLLLDGLDEVREEDSQRVLKEIRDFSDHFRDNHFVMTCRIAAREYTFEKFTEVEVANFDDEQISTFATNWFTSKAVKADTFLERLEDKEPIKELATNPLLLTLLCLAFEESGDFPANRSELYKEGLDALLKKWDAKRGIYRDQVYKKLSPQRKEDLLSKIALTTFECGDYFFKQKAAEQYITEYIRNLPNASTEPEALQLDTEAVLRSIEAQHGLLVERAKGIYSFSHLTFHEYFTAREIVFRTQPLEEALQNLIGYMNDKSWREVFLLAVGMLQPNADRLLVLMKQEVDNIVAGDEKIQKFLIWLERQSLSDNISHKLASSRAFYIDKFIVLKDNDIVPLIKEILTSVNNLVELNKFSSEAFTDITYAHTLHSLCDACIRVFNTIFDFALKVDPDFESSLKQSLQKQQKQLLEIEKEEERLIEWTKTNSLVWIEQLRDFIMQYQNINREWQFSNQQEKALKQYYLANRLLVHCLNSDCYVSREVRQEIEDTLLLPIAEIEKRKQR